MTGPNQYAHSVHAEQNRAAKARALAVHCWAHGVTPGDVDDLVGFDLPGMAAFLRRLARDAGVNPPSPGSPTWGLVVELLGARALWDEAHPGDPRTVRPHPGHYDHLLHPEPEPEAEANPDPDADYELEELPCEPPAPEASTPSTTPPPSGLGSPGRTGAPTASSPSKADPVVSPSICGSSTPGSPAPRGWADLTALGPIPGTTCGIPTGTGRDDVCGAPAVAWVRMWGGLHTPRCAAHPPVGESWGSDLNWAPTGPCRAPGMACWCPRCPPRHHTPSVRTA